MDQFDLQSCMSHRVVFLHRLSFSVKLFLFVWSLLKFP